MNGLYHLFSLFSPDFDADGIVDDALSTLQLKSSWTPNVNAGGSRNNFELFATNPKFKLTVIHQSNQVTRCLIMFYNIVRFYDSWCSQHCSMNLRILKKKCIEFNSIFSIAAK